MTARRLMAAPPLALVRKSPPYRAADTTRRFVATSFQVLRRPGAFADVRTCVLFIGHVKSGGSLIGALLDAHPNAAVADEIDVLRYVAAGFRRDQIFHLLAKGSRREAMKGRVTARRLEAYDLRVPGQMQGRHERLVALGDSRASPTTRRLGREPELLDRLSERLGAVRPRFIHVVRHPLDPIAVSIARGGRTAADAIADHASQCASLLEIRARVPSDDLLTVRYEDLAAEPRERLAAICAFLGLDAPSDYLSACAELVDPSVPPERARVRWDAGSLAAVRSTIDRTSFLSGYDPDA